MQCRRQWIVNHEQCQLGTIVLYLLCIVKIVLLSAVYIYIGMQDILLIPVLLDCCRDLVYAAFRIANVTLNVLTFASTTRSIVLLSEREDIAGGEDNAAGLLDQIHRSFYSGWFLILSYTP